MATLTFLTHTVFAQLGLPANLAEMGVQPDAVPALAAEADYIKLFETALS